MAETKQIVGETPEDIWRQVAADLSGEAIYDYSALLVLGKRKVELGIDIDPGGGFESGYAYTFFAAPVSPANDFRFALHHKDWRDAAGKFFGMEDVVIGYPEFDDAMIIKTGDPDRTRRIFADIDVRKTLQALRSFNLHLAHHHVAGKKGKETTLELNIEEEITDPEVLKDLYGAFCKVLDQIEAG